MDAVRTGDCLTVLAEFESGTIDLAYLDPPFNTGRTMNAVNGSYGDSWDGVHHYVRFMRPRVEQIHRTLKSNVSILLHCDWRTCHHFWIMLEEIFGRENFVNHLIWLYGLGGSSP